MKVSSLRSQVSGHEIGIIGLALAVLAILTLYQLDLPGLNYDEAIVGLPTMQFLLGQPVETFRGTGIPLGARLFPVMTWDYVGALDSYLLLPFFAILGPSVLALRLMPILVAAIGLVLTYLLARLVYNRRVAAISILLLAVHPSFVFWSREGVLVTLVTTTLALATLLSVIGWWRACHSVSRQRRQRDGFLLLAAFLTGLGLSAKILFLWFLVGSAVAVAFLHADRILAFVRQRWRPAVPLSLPQFAAIIVAFLAGGWMLVVYNLQTAGGTFQILAKNLFVSYYGVQNPDLISNLQTRLEHLRVFLNGGSFWYLGGPFADDLYPLAFGAAVVSLLVLAAWQWRQSRLGNDTTGWRWSLFPPLLIALMVLQSCFTVSGLWVNHYTLLLPWPQLTMAIAADRWMARRRGALLPIAGALVILGAMDVGVDIQYHQALRRSGGYGARTSAIVRLAAYLDEHKIAAPVALDWGIKPNVQLLTLGRVNPVEIFGFDWQPDPGFAQRVETYLANPDTVYLFHSLEETVFPRSEVFQKILVSRSQKARLETPIYDTSGRVVFLVMRVVP